MDSVWNGQALYGKRGESSVGSLSKAVAKKGSRLNGKLETLREVLSSDRKKPILA